jgi:hypothetical protein
MMKRIPLATGVAVVLAALGHGGCHGSERSVDGGRDVDRAAGDGPVGMVDVRAAGLDEEPARVADAGANDGLNTREIGEIAADTANLDGEATKIPEVGVLDAASDGGTVSGTGDAVATGGRVGTSGMVGTGGSISTGGVVAIFDPTWAQWPMPNGQVDVTAGAPNLASYTDNGNGTVTDQVTGLMWQQAVPAGSYTWEQATAYCPTLTLASHGDWRLPKRIELVSIVDFGRSSPAIDTTYFPSTPSGWFWSSSPLAGPWSSGWGVNFYFGQTYDNHVSYTGFVRCVR